MQAGPLIRTKIPKDPDGKQKTFGFAVYKHEVSAPYAVQLLNGTSLFGRTLHVQFRSGGWRVRCVSAAHGCFYYVSYSDRTIVNCEHSQFVLSQLQDH